MFLSFSLLLSCAPTFTLFPYTTLFRSLVTVVPSRFRNPKKPCESDSTDALPEKTGGAPSKPPNFTATDPGGRSEEHTSELQSPMQHVSRRLPDTKNRNFWPGGAEPVST